MKTLDQEIKAMEHRLSSKCVRRDEYQLADKSSAFWILRFDTPDGKKTYRPIYQSGNGWKAGKPAGERGHVLFNLPALLKRRDETVIVCEGEKCVEALSRVGFLATTSASGASSTKKADWSPLIGRKIIIWPDNDLAGATYAAEVVKILEKLDLRACPKILLPGALSNGLPAKGDAFDYIEFLEEQPSLAEAEIKAHLEDAFNAQKTAIYWPDDVDLELRLIGNRLQDPNIFRAPKFFSTGFLDIDACLGGGLVGGEATNLFAPSSMGKSSFAINLALNLAKQNISVGVLSLEMTEIQALALAICAEAKISRTNLRQERMTAEEGRNYQDAIERVNEYPLAIVDRKAWLVNGKLTRPDTEKITALVKSGIRHMGWRVLIIDYLDKVGHAEKDEYARSKILSDWAVSLAQESGIHLIALMQANKNSFSKRDKNNNLTIRLEDCKGPIEGAADFDAVIAITRKDWNSDQPDDQSLMSANVLKARYGPGGCADLLFDRTTGRIEALSKQSNGYIESLKIKPSGAKSPAEVETDFALFFSCLGPRLRGKKRIEDMLAERVGVRSNAQKILRAVIDENELDGLEAIDGQQDCGDFWAIRKGSGYSFKLKPSEKSNADGPLSVVGG